ncbi:hypothetical protein HQ403_03325 [Candidatus Kaiserbacteria bacterium]|nr:hypothetical protein [Candidatus Kaiserbacteria bacterium]
MHQGNWKCGGCGAAITELPFEPRGDVGLMCKACFSKSRGPARNPSDNSGGNTGGDKPKHQGDWKCSGCSKAITELPFKPRETSNLLCLDCFKQSRAV